MSANLLALLPEYVLTLTGVLIVLIEAVLKPAVSRKPLGWLAIAGATATGLISWYQLRLGALTAFSGSIQVDAFSIFFHLLIGAVVVATLLGSLDYFDGHASHAGEYFALVLFGAAGMMLMTCSVDLLMVFIGLEISSISTYILAGFRKGEGTSVEASIKYFLLGSFATAFFLYGIALAYGATGSTGIAAIAAGLGASATPRMAFLALAMMSVGLGFKVSAAPFHLWTPDVYQGAPAPVVGLMSTAPKAAAFAVLLRITFCGFPLMQQRWSMLLWGLAALSMTIGNLGALKQTDVKRMLAYSSIAHAGYLLAAFTAFPHGGHQRRLLLHRRLRRDERRGLRRHHADRRIQGDAAQLQGLPGPRPAPSSAGRAARFVPSLADRDSLHRRLLRQVLRLQRRHPGRPRMARRHRPDQQRRCLLLLPAAAQLDVHKARRDGVSNNSRLCSCRSACPRASDLPSPPRPRCCSAFCPATSSTWPTPPARACAQPPQPQRLPHPPPTARPACHPQASPGSPIE